MRDFECYERLAYHAVWEHVATPDGDRYWQVHLQEIPAVAGRGSTEGEALGDPRERFEEYVGFHLDEGLDIPEPEGPAGRDATGQGTSDANYSRGPGGDGSGADGSPHLGAPR